MLSKVEINEKKHWDKYAQKYDVLYTYLEKFTRYKIFKKTKRMLGLFKKYRVMLGSKKILEIGCGTGEYTKIIAKALPKSKITALDISPNIIKTAKEKCRKYKNIKFIASSIFHNNFRNSSFDAIYGYYVLHHLDLDKTFKEVERLLKPGGIAYFCEPNILNPVVYLIKTNKYLKNRAGDTKDEWAINPLTIGKHNQALKVKDLSMSEYVLQNKIFQTPFLIKMDKLTEVLSRVPLIKYFGGSVQILLQKEIDSVIPRSEIEKEFHDKWAKKINPSSINFKDAFEAPVSLENRYTMNILGDIKGKKILDLGCGVGDASVYFASKGADVYAIDVSPEMVRLAQKLASLYGYGNKIHASTMLAEKLKFEDNFFDYVYGMGVLHHVDCNLTIQEVKRVLKKGGTAVFTEPLAHNPVINIYRKIADKVRTPTEFPLKYQELDSLSTAKFRRTNHKEFRLTSLLIFIWFYLIERSNPNKERYWLKIINESQKVEKPFSILNKIDDYLFNRLPFLRRYAWYTVLTYEK